MSFGRVKQQSCGSKPCGRSRFFLRFRSIAEKEPLQRKEGDYAGCLEEGDKAACEDLPYAAVRKASRLSVSTFSRKYAICLSDSLYLRAKSNVV